MIKQKSIPSRDMALLAVHEFIGGKLPGNASLKRCLRWCDEREFIPARTKRAVKFLRKHQ